MTTSHHGADAGLVIVSNRGPISYGVSDDGQPVAGSPGGGLAATIGGGVRDGQTLWVAAAMTDGDRLATTELADDSGELHAEGYRLRLVPIEPAVFDAAYNTVANEVLWFWHHHMFDLTRTPLGGPDVHEAWASYRAYNEAMAETVAAAAASRATVLVHDYHLALVPGLLRKMRPDLRIAHFSHTPWVDPSFIHVLPNEIVDELLDGMCAADAVGFHSPRWADAFAQSCIARDREAPSTFVAPAAADHASVVAAMDEPDFDDYVAEVDGLVGDRRCIVRVDRMEPSKNLLRGLAAFDALLDAHPEHRGEVTFVSIAYPSRTDLEEYLRYADDVVTAVADINARWGTPGWTPVVLITEEGFTRAVAALGRADVVFVNPMRDGLNLVAYEAQTASDRDAVLLLSHEAGAWDDLGRAGAVGVNPFDVCEQAAVMHDALTMPMVERASRAARLRRAATARSPKTWLDAQIAAATASANTLDLRASAAMPVVAAR
jgi:trehalose 6-phosphate synthase